MEKIFDQVAKNNEVTKGQVKKDIDKAIEIAIKNSKGNPKAEEFWNEFIKGETLISEEVIKKIAKEVIAKNKIK